MHFNKNEVFIYFQETYFQGKKDATMKNEAMQMGSKDDCKW